MVVLIISRSNEDVQTMLDVLSNRTCCKAAFRAVGSLSCCSRLQTGWFCCNDVVQERLRNLFPGLAGEMGPEQPSFFEWAFACVRSRAFRLSKQRFAFVPFMDIANHSSSPNAGFRYLASLTAPLCGCVHLLVCIARHVMQACLCITCKRWCYW